MALKALITIDASAAAAWLLPDETSEQADELFAQAVSRSVSLQAPGLWAWEVGNLLRMAQRRGRMASGAMRQALQVLHRAGVQLEAPPDEMRMQATLDLSGETGLTFYDASYLELALRTGAQLATKDAALRRAAIKAGLDCPSL